MQVVADCNVAAGGRVATGSEREREKEEDEASRGVIGGGYRRRGVGGNGGGRDRNQTSRHGVEGVDGEGSTPVRTNDPCAFVCACACMYVGSHGVAGKDETKGVPRGRERPRVS